MNVSAARDEHAEHLAEFYRDMFDVQLNHLVSISFVPVFAREPWPPSASDDEIASAVDARRSVVAASSLAVTPYDERQNETETFLDENGSEHTLFYTSTDDYRRLAAELNRLAETSAGMNAVKLVSDLASPTLHRLLLERIVVSGKLDSYAMKLLGR